MQNSKFIILIVDVTPVRANDRGDLMNFSVAFLLSLAICSHPPNAALCLKSRCSLHVQTSSQPMRECAGSSQLMRGCAVQPTNERVCSANEWEGVLGQPKRGCANQPTTERVCWPANQREGVLGKIQSLKIKPVLMRNKFVELDCVFSKQMSSHYTD